MNSLISKQDGVPHINWFGVCYWAAAGVQVVGSFNVFGTVGGSVLHAIAGALCLELLILALNAYGTTQTGGWMACICTLSLALIAASAMFQVADLLSHTRDADLASRLGSSYYALLRTTVPMVPSVAMAAVTVIKFVDARRSLIRSAPSTTPDAPLEHDTAHLISQAVEGALQALRGEFSQLHQAHAHDMAELRCSVQTVAADLAALTLARRMQPASRMQKVVQVQATSSAPEAPLQLAPPAQDLQAAIAALRGTRLVDAVDTLVLQGFNKTAIAAVLGKPAYALAPSRISQTEVL